MRILMMEEDPKISVLNLPHDVLGEIFSFFQTVKGRDWFNILCSCKKFHQVGNCLRKIVFQELTASRKSYVQSFLSDAVANSMVLFAQSSWMREIAL